MSLIVSTGQPAHQRGPLRVVFVNGSPSSGDAVPSTCEHALQKLRDQYGEISMVRHDAPSFPGKALLGELQRVLTAGECDVIILSQLRDAAGLRKLCFAAVHHQVRVIIPEGYVDSAESLPIHLYLFSFDTAIEYERRRNRFLREARAMKSKDHAQQKR